MKVRKEESRVFIIWFFLLVPGLGSSTGLTGTSRKLDFRRETTRSSWLDERGHRVVSRLETHSRLDCEV